MMYDMKIKQCKLYGGTIYSLEHVVGDCQQMTGPKISESMGHKPEKELFSQCLSNQDNPCMGMVRSSCQYDVEIIKTLALPHSERLDGRRKCQELCNTSKDCQSYAYGLDSKQCQLRGRSVGPSTCDEVYAKKGVNSEKIRKCKADMKKFF